MQVRAYLVTPAVSGTVNQLELVTTTLQPRVDRRQLAIQCQPHSRLQLRHTHQLTTLPATTHPPAHAMSTLANSSWPVGRSVGRSDGGSVSGSVGQSVGRSVGGSVSGSVGQSVGQSVGGSVGQSVGRWVSGSVSGSVGQSVSGSVGQWVGR